MTDMTPSTIERVRDRSLELSLCELGGDAPPDRVAEIVQQRRARSGTLAGSTGTDRTTPAQRGTARRIVAALVLLAVGVTTGVFALSPSDPANPADGPVVFVVHGHALVAYEFDSGEVHWRTPVPKGDYGRPVVSAGTVYLAAADGRLLAVRATTGKITARRQIGGHGFLLDGRVPFSVDGGTILGAMVKTTENEHLGRFAAVAVDSGKIQWSVDVPGTVRGHVIVGKRVIAACRGGMLVALGRQDGEELGRLATGISPIHAPIGRDGLVYVAGGKQVVAIAAKTMEPVWKHRTGADGNLTAPILAGDLLIVATTRLTALVAADGRMVWQSTGIGSGALIRAEGVHVVVADRAPNGSRLSIYRLRNGVAQWKRTLASAAPSGLATLSGYAFLASDGRLEAFRMSDSLPKWQAKFAGVPAPPCTVDLGVAVKKDR